MAAILLLLVALSASEPPVKAVPSSSSAPTPSEANVVLITVDTLRYDALGFSGNSSASTPNLDRLAAGGRVFTNAYAHNVVTLPSHANILTGLYPYQHGVRENSGFRLPEEVPTLATRLRDAGYSTAALVGAFPLDSRFGLNRGFDLYDDDYPESSRPDEFRFAERSGDEVVSRALEWWRTHAGERRFLWVHLYDPHAPYLAPEPYASSFRQRPYAGEVAATDAYLGPLLGPFLERREPPTLIVFTADHGEALGDHGELTHGLFAYQATLKAPLVMWGPGVSPGSDSRLAGHVDIVPTVLAALDLDVPDTLPGRSLLEPPRAGRQLYFEALSTYFNRGWAPLRGIIASSTKAIALPLPELYDLDTDPGEQRNLATAERPRLRALLADLPREKLASRPHQVSNEEIQRLRSLGYLSGTTSAKTRFGPEDDPKRLADLDRKMHRFIDAYSRGELALAEELARAIVAERPQMAMGHEHLALTLRRQEKPSAALAVLQEAVDRGVGGASLLRQLGLTLAEVGRAQEAVELLEPLAADDDPATLNALGVGLTEAGRQREAIAVLERALSIAPTDAKAHETLGAVYLRLERPAQARRYLERAVELNPSLPISWNSLGVARSWLGEDSGALVAWERALELDPNQFDALYNLGLTAAKVGRLDTARRALERFVATAPPDRFGADIVKARRLLQNLGS